MADYGANITYQSTPDYDSWGYDEYWSCADWMIWYERLKEHYGADEARLMWMSAWEAQDAWESNYNWCKYSQEFNEFTHKNGLGASHLLADTLVGGTNIVGGALKGVAWVGRNLVWIAPVALIGAGVVYALKFRKLLK